MQVSDLIINNRYQTMDSVIRQTEKVISGQKTETPKTGDSNGLSFREALDRQLTAVSFSKHANHRAIERNIQVSDADLSRLGDACEQAREKGVKDALIMMNDSAFIVNAPSRIVVTVIDKKEMQSNVITNIDGAIFL